MLSINWSDVISILQTCRPYLIALGVIVVLAILVMIFSFKLKKPVQYLVRRESGIAILLTIVVIGNMVCIGPMSTILTLVSGEGSITEETSAESETVGEKIASEGIVLLENEDQVLPLSSDNLKLNVFGWASTNPCYGGTGSGALSDAYEIVDLLSGLENAGIEYNSELSDFYTAYRAERPVVGMFEQDWTLPEPSVDSYSENLMANALEYSDTAMVVLSRVGGEHIDLPQDVTQVNYTNNSEDYDDFPVGTSYLELSQSERNMLEMVCENFDDVIVVYNGANTLQMDFVDDYASIKGVIWCPGTGQNGFNALGSVLNGEVNPSGKTADTFVSNLQDTLSWNNFGDFVYDNMEEFQISGDDPYVPNALPTFVNYTEGIYVGYKFYETAADEGLINYDDAVVYPFGYGLSYTTFTQEMGKLTEKDGQITIDVTVTNTGDVAGKEVVQVYYNPPYSNGGIEKSTVNMAAFDKTDLLNSGESQTMTLTFALEDMASYDTYGTGAYVLEQGDYIISVNADSHNEYNSQIYTVAETINFDGENARSTDDTTAVNQFDFAEGEVTYLSRADGFANYEEAKAGPASYSMPEADKAQFVNNSNFKLEESDVEMPVTGANNGLELVDLRGVNYDDTQWDQLLDQLTISDMNELISLGGYQTAAADSVGKLATTDCDGPASINNNFTGVGSIGFPSAVMIANTWNEDLALSFGESIGKMANEMNVSGWYAPAMNIHRNAFAGRNFEYYSEDGFLSGKMASNAVQGAAESGVYAYIKHFALNDQETNRWEMLCTWANEQSIREIYLKPFEIAVKEGNATAVMSSYNYIGTQWAGASNALLNNVLRDEWGFEGFVLTDYFADFGYMDATRSIYNGGDSCLINRDVVTNNVTDTDNAAIVDQMRRASKNILYTVVNSRAYEEENIETGILMWQIVLVVVDVLVAVLIILLEVMIISGYKRKQESVIISIESEREIKKE
ncbi:MAG: glycoside hydrolase family 3 N-terminal domain-containing protein [Dysgonomonas sp.]